MTKYLLVSFQTCPWVQRVAIVLREKKADFELRHIEMDNRPNWFLAISPHNKVPVLRMGEKISLFESNAIVEYLDETIPPRLHPEDPIERAVNRAWTDYLPTFSGITAIAYAQNESEYDKAAGKILALFEQLEKALEKQGSGPFFNGAQYSLVDASYAPFLQRYFILNRVKTLGLIQQFPSLSAWAEVLVKRDSTHTFPPAEFEGIYRENLRRRGTWMSRFVDNSSVAAAL